MLILCNQLHFIIMAHVILHVRLYFYHWRVGNADRSINNWICKIKYIQIYDISQLLLRRLPLLHIFTIIGSLLYSSHTHQSEQVTPEVLGGKLNTFWKKNSQYQIRRHIASSRLVSRRQDPQFKLSYTSKCDRQTGRTAVKFPSDLTTLLQVMRFSYTFICISDLDYVWHRYLYAVYYRI